MRQTKLCQEYILNVSRSQKFIKKIHLNLYFYRNSLNIIEHYNFLLIKQHNKRIGKYQNNTQIKLNNFFTYKQKQKVRGGERKKLPNSTAPIVIKQHTFCYDDESSANKTMRKKTLQHKEKHKIPKELTQRIRRAQEKRWALQQYSQISPKERLC